MRKVLRREYGDGQQCGYRRSGRRYRGAVHRRAGYAAYHEDVPYGGVAGGDITQGLPRVEELFEARKPRGLAVISEIAGTVDHQRHAKKREITVANDAGEAKTYLIPYGSRVTVDGRTGNRGGRRADGRLHQPE